MSHIAVPPTRYYLSRRAELFRVSARRARDEGDTIKCEQLLHRAREYAFLAGEIDFTQEGNNEHQVR